ncbi:MAG: Gfo/Idh/MocA family oxidoreductase [Lactobacillales bacterium]|nr:Gfo/Idh/MocA family oxidoreductase [Lactobacillales bacterium]
MLRVAIIGLGTISYIHQLGIQQSGLGKLVAVCDSNPSTAGDYADLPFYDNCEEMLEKENLDVVHICLPHDLHAPIAQKCMEYGVNVFLEKPLSLTYEEGLNLSKAVSDSKYKLGVCFQNRYNRTTTKLIDILENQPVEEIGSIRAVKGVVTWFRPESYYEAQPWRGQLERAGGGTMINQSIHTLDLMHLFGGNPLTCNGHLLNLLDYKIEVEDTAVARYEFEENISGLYFATNSYAVNSPVELEVITERRRFVIKDYKLFEYKYNSDDGVLLESDDIFESTKSYYGQGHLLAIQTFYKAVINKTEDYIHIEDALGSMLMIDMMRKSNETKETVHASTFTKSE